MRIKPTHLLAAALLALLTLPVATLPALCAVTQPAPPAAAHPAVVNRTFCVFDPSGAQGAAFKMAQRYKTAALAWGVRAKLVPYTSESVAANDFRAGKCDGAVMTGVRTRSFVKETATLEALGALPNYQLLKDAITVLAKTRAAPLDKSGPYETAAIFPSGAVYLLVRNRSIDSIGALAGKNIATIAWDPAARTMVNTVAAAMVPADIGTFAGMFNNGKVDACYAPASAVVPLELEKGMGTKGGIIDLPLSQLTFQTVIRSARFPAGFGVASRKYAAKHFDEFVAVAKKAAAALPAKLWIKIPPARRRGYLSLLRKVRLQLAGTVYNTAILRLMGKLRCRRNRSAADCGHNPE